MQKRPHQQNGGALRAPHFCRPFFAYYFSLFWVIFGSIFTKFRKIFKNGAVGAGPATTPPPTGPGQAGPAPTALFLGNFRKYFEKNVENECFNQFLLRKWCRRRFFFAKISCRKHPGPIFWKNCKKYGKSTKMGRKKGRARRAPLLMRPFFCKIGSKMGTVSLHDS